MTDQNTAVVDNRTADDATHDDAKGLSLVYRTLSKVQKNLKDAQKDLASSWATGDVEAAREVRDTAQMAADATMDESWGILKGLPVGTVASGGATPQTIALQFFSANLNRKLGNRLTAGEARSINKRSFA